MFYSTSTFRVEGRRYRVIGATRQKYGQPSLRRARQEKDKLKTFYSAIKKKKKNAITPLAATWMDLEIIVQSEMRQTEKDKYCTILLICGI